MNLFFWTKNRCYNGGTRHNFEARYTVHEERDMSKALPDSAISDLIDIAESDARTLISRTETYHGHFCTWCGKKS